MEQYPAWSSEPNRWRFWPCGIAVRTSPAVTTGNGNHGLILRICAGWRVLDARGCAHANYEFRLRDPPALESDYGGDSATLVFDPVLNSQHASFTYHVIYSESYKVPALFFRGFHSDGGALDTEDVKRMLTADSLLLLEKFPWTFLTQEEHPVLHQPWLPFHPCGTSQVMALILLDWRRFHDEFKTNSNRQPLSLQDGTPLRDTLKTSVIVEENLLQFKPSSFPGQYLLAWLSIVGQVARLDLPLSLFKKQASGGQP